jgi:signal transduction histidine kinase
MGLLLHFNICSCKGQEKLVNTSMEQPQDSKPNSRSLTHPKLRNTLPVHSFFQINEGLFWLINVLVGIGLIYGIYTDTLVLRAHPAIQIGNFLSVLTMVVSYWLTKTKRITRNQQIGVLHAIVVYVNLLTGVVQGLQGYLGDTQMHTVVISMSMVGASAFLVSKQLSLVLGLSTFGFYTFLVVNGSSEYVRIWYPLVSVVILGYIVVMHYYRGIVDDLNTRFIFSKQALEHTNDDLRRMRQKAEMVNLQNRPFVVFGKNTAGLVHDFKNDLSLLAATKSLIEMKLERSLPIQGSDLDGLVKGIEKLQERIERVRYVTSARDDDSWEMIQLGQAVERGLYPFQLTPEVKTSIRFVINAPLDPVYVMGNRYDLLQIIENVVRNSCEAILEDSGNGSIEITISHNQEQATLEFSDSGPGISFCLDCDKTNCLDCQEFEIGKTTKKTGSGFGMRNVLAGVKAMNGALTIASSAQYGTRMTFTFPLAKG